MTLRTWMWIGAIVLALVVLDQVGAFGSHSADVGGSTAAAIPASTGPTRQEKNAYNLAYSTCAGITKEAIHRDYGYSLNEPIEEMIDRMTQEMFSPWLSGFGYSGCIDAYNKNPPQYG